MKRRKEKQPWQLEWERKMEDQKARFASCLNSDGYRDRTVSCGRELLAPWLASLPLDPEWRVLGTEIQVECRKDLVVRVSISVEMDFLDWKATYRDHMVCKCSGLLMDLPVSAPLEQMREVAFSATRTQLEKLTERMGQTLQSALRERQIPARAGRNGDQIWTGVQDIRLKVFEENFGRHPIWLLGRIREEREPDWAQAALQMAWNRMEKAWPGETPPWLRRVEPVACRFQVDMDPDQQVCVICRLKLKDSGEMELTARAVGDRVSRLVWNVPPERIPERLGEVLEDLARKARKEAVEQLAPYEMVDIPPAWSGNPAGQTAWELLTKGSVQLGQVQVRLMQDTGRAAKGGETIWDGPPLNARIFWMGEDRCLLSHWPAYGRRSFPQIPLGLMDPGNPGGLLAMMKALGTIAEQYGVLEVEGVRNPALTFCLSPEGLCGLSALDLRERLKIPGEVFARDPVQWGKEFFASLLPVLRERAAEIRRHQEALERSNEVQLGMLQFLYRRRSATEKICRQDLENRYRDHPLFSQAAVERYAKELSERKLCVEGRWEPLVILRQEAPDRFRWGMYGDDGGRSHLFEYESLRPNPAIPPDRILGLSPRRTSLDDWADLRTSVRQDWLAGEGAEIVESGDRERCWAFITALPEKTSKAAAAAFLKSDNGLACLRMLTGADREYALLLLEDLPGCKRLAVALRREVEEEGAEAGAGDGGESFRAEAAEDAAFGLEGSPEAPAPP